MKSPSAGRVIVDDTLSDLSQSEQFIHACAYHTESQQTTSIETWVRPAVKISFLVAHTRKENRPAARAYILCTYKHIYLLLRTTGTIIEDFLLEYKFATFLYLAR